VGDWKLGGGEGKNKIVFPFRRRNGKDLVYSKKRIQKGEMDEQRRKKNPKKEREKTAKEEG